MHLAVVLDNRLFGSQGWPGWASSLLPNHHRRPVCMPPSLRLAKIADEADQLAAAKQESKELMPVCPGLREGRI
jgi:hypothetical protein